MAITGLFTVSFMCLSSSVQNKIEKMDPENLSKFGSVIIVFLPIVTMPIGYVLSSYPFPNIQLSHMSSNQKI